MSEIIHLLKKKVALHQPKQGFKTSMDAVLLASACIAKDEESVLDMGCGVGGALFCLLFRMPHLKITGIEKEPLYLDLAKKNAILNNTSAQMILDDVIHFRVTDPKMRFNHIICNPPYFDADHHTPSPVAETAHARGAQDTENKIEKWIMSALYNLKNHGSFTLILPASQMDKAIRVLGKKFGKTEIFPILTRPNEPAKRVIIRTFKDRKSPCTLHSQVVLHKKDNSFTNDARKLLEDGVSIETLLSGNGN